MKGGTSSITFVNVGFTRLRTGSARPKTNFAINLFGVAVDGDINDRIAIRLLQLDVLAIRRAEVREVRWRGIGRIAAGIVIKLGGGS